MKIANRDLHKHKRPIVSGRHDLALSKKTVAPSETTQFLHATLKTQANAYGSIHRKGNFGRAGTTISASAPQLLLGDRLVTKDSRNH